MFEVQTWGWDGIYRRDVVAYNRNELSFTNGWIPQSLSYINIFLHFIPFKWFRIVLLPSISRSMKEANIAPLTLVYLPRYLGLWLLMSAFSGWERGGGGGVPPPLIKRQIHAPIALGNSCINVALTPSLVNLGSLKITPHTMLISFGKLSRY